MVHSLACCLLEVCLIVLCTRSLLCTTCFALCALLGSNVCFRQVQNFGTSVLLFSQGSKHLCCTNYVLFCVYCAVLPSVFKLSG